MNPASWWGQKVSDWLPRGKTGPSPADKEVSAAGNAAGRTERLHETPDASVVRKALKLLQAVADGTVSEVEGGRRARAFAQWYAAASAEERRQACILMSERFAPDPERIHQAREAYESAVGTAEEGVAEIRLRKALYSARTRLLQRFAVFPEGMRFLVDLRTELLPQLKSEKRLLALEAELESLFSTWFDVAFLELRRISWDSPASLVEKLIQYEAVHDIKSWADVKNRLDSDRRCYGFFHARLPDDPLIFVEVAFTREIASNIVPLLDETAEAVDLGKATTAIFYSISNTQTGLKCISFGDSLIKRVVETLKTDFPQLRTFATLSPIPGFRVWYRKNAMRLLQDLPEKHRRTLGRFMGYEPVTPEHIQAWLDQGPHADAKSPGARWLLHCASRYLGHELEHGRPVDPVARFHLGNGARVENIHWLADPSAKGLQQSWGMMVNYLYDLKKFDRHRRMLGEGKIPISGGVADLSL
ncbi:MAG: malonyl-CoA decarboxylase [Limnohabitans sp.]